MGKKLKTIDAFVKSHKTASAAARAMGADYGTFNRWLKRESTAPANSATRKLAAAQGVELPGLTYK